MLSPNSSIQPIQIYLMIIVILMHFEANVKNEWLRGYVFRQEFLRFEPGSPFPSRGLHWPTILEGHVGGCCIFEFSTHIIPFFSSPQDTAEFDSSSVAHIFPTLSLSLFLPLSIFLSLHLCLSLFRCILQGPYVCYWSLHSLFLSFIQFFLNLLCFISIIWRANTISACLLHGFSWFFLAIFRVVPTSTMCFDVPAPRVYLVVFTPNYFWKLESKQHTNSFPFPAWFLLLQFVWHLRSLTARPVTAITTHHSHTYQHKLFSFYIVGTQLGAIFVIWNVLIIVLNIYIRWVIKMSVTLTDLPFK